MGWLDTFLARRSAAKGLTVTRAPAGFVTEVIDLRASMGRRRPSATADLQSTMSDNELVFACIDIKASTTTDPRLIVQRRVERRGKVTYEEVPGHPFRQLIMRPNAMMTEADLMRAAIVSWDISNPRRFYAEKEYDRGLLVGLHPLNPARMRPKYNTAGDQVIGYIWGDGRERREYALDELVIRSAPTWYRPPPLVAALGAVASDTAQTDYIAAFFANGGIPPGLLKYNRPLDQPKRDEIRDRWRAAYGNASGRQHDVGILDVNVEYQEIGSRLDQLQSPGLRSVSESRICMVFGVPPLIVYAYVGLLRATYANLRDAWSGFWDATMSPTFKDWRAFWTWSLLSEFEEDRAIRTEAVRLHYDLSQVAALQEDVDAAQNRARANFAAGGISFNEFRAAIGSEPVPGADDLYTARQLVPLGAMVQPLAEPTTTASDAAKATRAAKALTDAGVQALERRLQASLRGYLTDQYGAAAAAARGA